MTEHRTVAAILLIKIGHSAKNIFLVTVIMYSDNFVHCKM